MFPRDELRKVPDNWDGCGALAPSLQEISTAELIHMTLPNGVKWQVVPLIDGGVQIESREGGMDVEITVRESTRE